MSHRVGIALGSNLGSRIGNLKEARDSLRQLAVAGSELLQGAIYQSVPVACPVDSPDFFNTVVEIRYEGSPHELLERTQAIEFRQGRKSSGQRNAPRVIDLDLLYFGDEILDTGVLELPHPRMLERLFVLQPLADIRPELILAKDHVSISEHLAHLDSEEVPMQLVQLSW